MKKALLTGITGQDGSYLTELLLSKGYEVHGIIRRASTFNTDRIDHLYKDPHESGAKMLLHYGDLSDASGLRLLIERVQPDEVYNLGAQSHVKVSYDQVEYTADVSEVDAVMPAHLEWVAEHYRDGLFLTSARRVPRTGVAS